MSEQVKKVKRGRPKLILTPEQMAERKAKQRERCRQYYHKKRAQMNDHQLAQEREKHNDIVMKSYYKEHYGERGEVMNQLAKIKRKYRNEALSEKSALEKSSESDSVSLPVEIKVDTL